MNFQTIFLSPANAASTSYVAYLKGYSQTPTDGNIRVLDSTALLNNAGIDPSTTYAAVTANSGFLTATSGAGLRGFELPAGVFNWDMNPQTGLGKSMLLAFQFKSASVPSINVDICGNGGGTLAGIKPFVNTSGRMAVAITDTVHAFFSGAGTGANLCDGQLHNVVIMIDGVGKKLYFQIDGATINSQYGSSIATITGSTANTGPFYFGSAGGGSTWDSGTTPTSPNVQFRNIHLLVMPTFPANFADILSYCAQSQNLFKLIPSSLIA